jgi:hypothetical protein
MRRSIWGGSAVRPGFYTHTDKVFVSFDDMGRLDRVYVAGLVDAAFAGGASGEAQVSQAADGNLARCREQGHGMHRGRGPEAVSHPADRRARTPVAGLRSLAWRRKAATRRLAAFDPSPAGGLPLGGGTGSPSIGGGGPGSPILTSGTGGGGDGEEPPPPPPPPPAPVPLPSAGLLLLLGIGGLVALRRRKTV